MTSPDFTNSERVLLHLSRHPFNGAAAPYELTQDGVAQAIGRTRAHAAIEIKKLRGEGLVEQHAEHIRGGAVKRQVALLTPSGIREAERLKAIAAERGLEWTSAIMAPPNPRTDMAKLMERCIRIQQDLDNVMKSIISLQAKEAGHE